MNSPNDDFDCVDSSAILRSYRGSIRDLYAKAHHETMRVLTTLDDEALLTVSEVTLAIMYDAPQPSYTSNLIHRGRIPVVRRRRRIWVTAAAVRAYLGERDARVRRLERVFPERDYQMRQQ